MTVECPPGFYLETLQPGDEVRCSIKHGGPLGIEGIFLRFEMKNDDLCCVVQAHTEHRFNWKTEKWSAHPHEEEMSMPTCFWLFCCDERDIDGMRTVIEVFDD